MTNGYIYILKCKDNSLYTGYTTNLYRRFRMHSLGKGAKYTRGRRPVKLVYYEKFNDKISAQKREYAIKQLTRDKKNLLIENSNLSILNDFNF